MYIYVHTDVHDEVLRDELLNSGVYVRPPDTSSRLRNGTTEARQNLHPPFPTVPPDSTMSDVLMCCGFGFMTGPRSNQTRLLIQKAL